MGPSLNNILGPFTLSTTNTFVGAGYTGADTLTISGKDVKVDGFSFAGVSSPSKGNYGIRVSQRLRFGHFNPAPSENITISNNTVTGYLHGILIDGAKSATVDGNTVTSSQGNALSIQNVPGSSTYSVTDNNLSDAGGVALTIGKVNDPGLTLTLLRNNFNGSRWGASLNNILGPFTLSTTNTFVGAGHNGGTTLLISGKDVKVDGFKFGALNGGVGIFVSDRTLFGHAVT